MMHYPAVLLLALVAPQTSWDYPNTSGQTGLLKSDGKVVSTYLSKHSTDSFSTVVAWYAKRTGFDSLPQAILDYDNRKPENSDLYTGSADAVTINGTQFANATAVYAFQPSHKHVMIVFTETDSGDLLSISIAGDSAGTTINHVRRLAVTSDPG